VAYLRGVALAVMAGLIVYQRFSLCRSGSRGGILLKIVAALTPLM